MTWVIFSKAKFWGVTAVVGVSLRPTFFQEKIIKVKIVIVITIINYEL